MPWSGGVYTRTNGTYNGAAVWRSDAAANIDILANRHDTHDLDLAAGINATLHKGGQNSATANISWGGFKIINLGDGTAATDAATFGQTVTALAYDSATRTITGTRAVGNLTVTLPLFTSTAPGFVPPPGTPTGRSLRDDGSWATPGAQLFATQRVTTSFNAIANTRYIIDANSVIGTLPAAPADGETIYFVLSGARTGCRVSRNGNTIMGLAEDLDIDLETNAFFGLVFNTNTGWRIV